MRDSGEPGRRMEGPNRCSEHAELMMGRHLHHNHPKISNLTKRQARECHRKHLLLASAATAGLCLIQLTMQLCQAKQHHLPLHHHQQQQQLLPNSMNIPARIVTVSGGPPDSTAPHPVQLVKRFSSDAEAPAISILGADLGAADIQVTTPVTGPPTCGYPGSPAHASVTFNTSQVVVGTASSYTCDNGYELLGPPRRLCQANGTWSPIGIPFCVLNVGLGKAAMQSSTAGHGSAQKAVDGLSSPYFQSSTCTMTDVESSPWWYVNLLEPYLVQIVRIDFGTACCGSNRQKATIAVRVGNNRPDLGNNPLCNRYHGYIEEGKPLFLPCTRPAPGAFVSIHLEAPSGSALSICETFIYTDHALSIEQCPSFRGQPLGSTATYNGKCYLFHNNQALTFDSARRYCESRGGSLVDETSPALQGFLSWELYRRHRNDQLMGQYWLGAQKDQRNPQNWKWINGKDVQISFWSSVPSAQNNCSRFDGSKGWLWSDTDCSANLNFICQYRPLSCGKPERPTNSTLINRNSDDSGNVIEYQCAPGNFLVGPRSRTCLPTGFFSDFAPKCKYLDCKFPAMIANGDYRLLNDTTSYQSVVNYFCNDGYQLYGKATLTCDLDERWNGPPPRCEPYLCPVPIPPANGYVKVTSNVTIPGTQATYDCRPGYELAGDRILTCTTTGSWDYSFPYCRERRQHMALPATLSQPTRQRPVAARPPSSGTVQFPSVLLAGEPQSPLFGAHLDKHGPPHPAPPSSTTAPSSSTTSTTTTTAIPSSTAKAGWPTTSTLPSTSSTAAPPPVATSSSQPASLNGLAGQSFGQQPAPVAINNPSTTGFNSLADSSSVELRPSISINQQQQSSQRRPPMQILPVSPFLVAPQLDLTPSQPQSSAGGSQNTPGPENDLLLPVGVTQPAISGGGGGSSSSSSSSTQQPPQRPQRPNSPTSGGFNGGAAASNIQSSFTVHQPTPMRGTHQSMGEQSLGMMSSSNTQTSSIYAPEAPSTSAGRVHSNYGAGARYSLDGIIASAIFGGFLFLGTIITIIVIIIRSRKKSNRSSIDAQTISTYDSNGEHSGLYRNYQQAWENLRFASPNSQPKSSGPGPGLSLAGASMPATTLRNFASSGHHMHLLGGAHHNAALLGSSGSGSSASSQSSTLGGVSVAPTNGSALMSHRSQVGHLQHHGAGAKLVPLNRPEDEPEDDEDDDDEHGDEQEIMSSDEFAAYQHQARHHHPHHHHNHNHHHNSHRMSQPPVGLAGEEFRDSDELTINAETAMGPGASATTAAGTLGRAGQRYSVASAGSLSRRTAARHQLNESSLRGGGQQAPSSAASNSTHSSRASQPSEEHLLDRLAYSNNWRPKTTAATAAASQQHHSIGLDSGSGSNHSAAGSSASILGSGSRNNGTRYS